MESKRLSPLDMTLDTSNPRFLNAQIDENGAIEYLIKYGELANLARSIADFKGLYPGERIVAVQQSDDKTVVLEGNRRTCACKLLLNRDLIPMKYRASFPQADQETLGQIEGVEVDLVLGMDEAERLIASRHLQGALLWESFAKMKFFSDRFKSGSSEAQIAAATNIPVDRVRKGIREFNLLTHGLNLPCWAPEEKETKLNVFTLEPDKYLRIFRTAGAVKAFGLRYDRQHIPYSGYGKVFLDKVIQRIMYCAFVADKEAEKIDTRTKDWEHVPGLKDIIESHRESETIDEQNAEVERHTDESNRPKSAQNSGSHSSQTHAGQRETAAGNAAGLPAPEPRAASQNARAATPSYSRATLIPKSCKLQISPPKLHNIYSELQKLDVNDFRNAAAIVFRVFFDLAMDEYLSEKRIPLKQSDPKLKDKLNAVLDHLSRNGIVSEREAGPWRRLAMQKDYTTIMTIDNFHDYVHRKDYQPNPGDLITIWDNLQQLMIEMMG